MSKEWNCTITLTLTGNGFDAENRSDYINKLKHSFDEEHNIKLSDDEISNVRALDSLSDEAEAQRMSRNMITSIGYRGEE
tara:strand:+ start:58 stop:297 length:240 start_codon:yes stop_codon:yes gene_type:complete